MIYGLRQGLVEGVIVICEVDVAHRSTWARSLDSSQPYRSCTHSSDLMSPILGTASALFVEEDSGQHVISFNTPLI